MSFGHTVRVSITIPLLLAAAACVPQDNAPKAANVAPPAVSPAPTQQSAAVGAPPIPATPPVAATAKTTPAPPATKIVTDLTVPRSGIGATYRCGNGGLITIQNLGSLLRVVRPDGTTEDFAASPANQSSRYQKAATHDAIVIDGREALVMKRGSTPQTCRR
ncbi:hypothetical protein RFM68_12320 [Mesorhizobium sp. MSK_1335]|uniref:C-type lysozyme inhibitor domain-containing protein n=1 Tax=Mesorhizobium montanum TaxID=3072323 RepID=A0ABU4ZMS5_9HYPH|nr:hypothetical protein [Mesorhizobium sp. MSK_1335]MDX8525296.1 hypothetical protein [Mesorhizobium sp. MSK_1335]